MKHINHAEIVALNLSACAPTYSKEWGGGSGTINPVADVADDLREIAAGKSPIGAYVMIKLLRGFAKTIPFMFAEGDNVPGPYKLMYDVQDLANCLTVAEMRWLQQPIRDGNKKLQHTWSGPIPEPVTLTVHTGYNTRVTINYDITRHAWRGLKGTPYYMQALEMTLTQAHSIPACSYRDLLHILQPKVDGEQFREIQRPFIEAALISQKLEYDARKK